MLDALIVFATYALAILGIILLAALAEWFFFKTRFGIAILYHIFHK